MKKLLFLLLTVVSASALQAQTITTVAGNGTAGFSGDGGAATAAELNYWTSGVTVDVSGNIYISDNSNNRIRFVNTAGIISTIAGNGSTGYSGDGGPATAASLHGPTGIVVDGSGNIYIADRYNNCVRKVDASGIITTLAGNGTSGYSGDGGTATAAKLNQPDGIAIDNAGNIYIADWYNFRVRKVNTSGIITTYAGTGAAGYTGDGGPATAATFNYVNSVATDLSGNVYVTDGSASVVRKIAPSGIITTIAGAGSGGYSGDGGPATAAALNAVRGVIVNAMGEIFIADRSNYCIRKVNTSGIISTIAGTAGSAGYGGDGGPATGAQLNAPNALALDAQGDIYICDGDVNSSIRKVHYIPTYVSDSFKIFVDKYCSGPQLTVVPNHYSSSMYVKTYFGDGAIDSSVISGSGAAIINHPYANNGTYTVKQVLHTAGVVIDSFQFTYNHILCNSFSVKFYFDANSNCAKDSSDVFTSQPVLVEVDSNSVAIDTISATSGFYYTAFGASGDVYAFKVISAPAGFHVTCPSSGILYDTLSISTFSNPIQYVGMECITSSSFDLSVNSAIPITGTFDQQGDIYVQNAYCMPVTGTITLHHSMKYSGTPDFVSPTPTTITPNTIVWNIGALSSTLSGPGHMHYVIYVPGALLTPGDTVQSYVTIDPETGDVDTSDNSDSSIDTVRAGCDPNAIWVKPAGCIASGAASTQLKYTINFENTGNDTAHNIYVMDTLSPYVDANSMRIVMASHEMYTTKIKDAAGHNIIKFDFPKINLLDSSHHGQCDGAVIYTINTIPGLPNGTDIKNRAGIYFDINDVVMTNQVTNGIGCPPVSVGSIQLAVSSPRVYPNPAYDVLNVETDGMAIASYTITNSVGSVVLANTINNRLTPVNIKALPSGLYFINLKGVEGTVVRRFVKW